MHDCISSVFAVCLYYNYHSVSTCMTVCIIFVRIYSGTSIRGLSQ